MKEIVFNNIQRWIPSSDIDGIDIKPETASVLRNMILRNGFITNAVDTLSVAFNTNVSSAISLGYKLIGYTNFMHSTKGWHEVFILYRESERKLYIYVDDEIVTIDDALAWVICLSNPNNINFNLVNDELKINLNTKAVILEQEVLLNLSLQWIEEITYKAHPDGYVKPAGWYIKPRWLGYIPTKSKLKISNVSNPVESMIEDFEDTTYIGGFVTNNSWKRVALDVNNYVLQNISSGSGRTQSAYFKNFRNLKSIKMRIDAVGDTTLNLNLVSFSDGSSVKNIFNTVTVPGSGIYDKELIIDVNELGGRSFDLQIDGWVSGYEGGSGATFQSYINIYFIEFFSHETMILAKYFNGSRALLTSGYEESDKFGIDIFNSDPKILISLDSTQVDWRIFSYELYIKNTSNTYILAGEWVIDGGWNLSGNILTEHLTFQDKDDAIKTLNFNYGLGEGIRVDTQHHIYSEVSFNNRIYAIDNGYLIYQTHIAGSGRIQPDSFPFSLEDNFGFIEESKANIIMNLFVINNNYLLLFMKNGFSLYMISSNRGSLQKELRILASSFTGFNPKSLTRDITGISTTIGTYFVTNEGIFFHSGDLSSVPINLIQETHKLFWRSVEKNNFGFFDYQDNEYWYATKVYQEERDDPEGAGGKEFTEFIVYEVSYKTFRFVRLNKAFYELAGYFQGKPLLRTDNKIELLDKSNTKGLMGYIETHPYDAGQSHYNKIAQYVLVILKNKVLNDNITIRLQFDDQSLVYSYTLSTNEKRMIRILPLSIRFNKVIASIVIPNKDKTPIAISEFKIGYTEDGIGRMAELLEHVSNNGVSNGYGRNYGRYYGRN